MAYGNKYTSEFQDANIGNFKTYLLEIAGNGYSGSSSVIKVAEKGLIRKDNNRDNKQYGVKDERLTLTAVCTSDFNTANILTEDERGVRVTVTREGDNQLIFQGYIEPTFGNEPYEEYGYFVFDISLVDGLKQLANLPYAQSNGAFFSGLRSIRQILTDCLNLTGLDLPLITCFNTYEKTYYDNGQTGATYDPLEQTYLDVDLFIDDNNQANYVLDVLKKITETLKCKLYLGDGVWYFVNWYELYDGNMIYRKYSSTGTRLSNGTAVLGKTVGTRQNQGYDFLAIEGDSFEFENALKEAKFTFELPRYKNLLLNPTFKDVTLGIFDHWTQGQGAVMVTEQHGSGTVADPFGVKISGKVETNLDNPIYPNYLQQTVYLGGTNDAFNSYLILNGEFYTYKVQMAMFVFKIQVRTTPNGLDPTYNSSYQYYYVDSSGQITTQYRAIEVLNRDENNKVKLGKAKLSELKVRLTSLKSLVKVASNESVTSVDLVYQVYQGINGADNNTGDNSGTPYVIYQNLSVSLNSITVNQNTKKQIFNSVNNKIAQRKESSNIYFADYPDKNNLGAMRKADGTVTALWKEKNGSSYKPLQQKILEAYTSAGQSYVRRFTGKVYGIIQKHQIITLSGFSGNFYVEAINSIDYYRYQSDIRAIQMPNTFASDYVYKQITELSDGTQIDSQVFGEIPSVLIPDILTNPLPFIKIDGTFLSTIGAGFGIDAVDNTPDIPSNKWKILDIGSQIATVINYGHETKSLTDARDLSDEFDSGSLFAEISTEHRFLGDVVFKNPFTFDLTNKSLVGAGFGITQDVQNGVSGTVPVLLPKEIAGLRLASSQNNTTADIWGLQAPSTPYKYNFPYQNLVADQTVASQEWANTTFPTKTYVNNFWGINQGRYDYTDANISNGVGIDYLLNNDLSSPIINTPNVWGGYSLLLPTGNDSIYNKTYKQFILPTDNTTKAIYAREVNAQDSNAITYSDWLPVVGGDCIGEEQLGTKFYNNIDEYKEGQYSVYIGKTLSIHQLGTSLQVITRKYNANTDTYSEFENIFSASDGRLKFSSDGGLSYMDYALKNDLPDLSTFYLKTETYNKSEVNSLIAGATGVDLSLYAKISDVKQYNDLVNYFTKDYLNNYFLKKDDSTLDFVLGKGNSSNKAIKLLSSGNSNQGFVLAKDNVGTTQKATFNFDTSTANQDSVQLKSTTVDGLFIYDTTGPLYLWSILNKVNISGTNGVDLQAGSYAEAVIKIGNDRSVKIYGTQRPSINSVPPLEVNVDGSGNHVVKFANRILNFNTDHTVTWS